MAHQNRIRALLTAISMATLATITTANGQDFSAVEITTTPIKGGVYMLEGAGGNIGLSVGEDGAFIIDDQFAPLSDKIKAAIAELTAAPVEYVINTHHHFDHTGGNEHFGDSGSVIVAHDKVHHYLANGSNIIERTFPPSPKAALPTITYSEKMTLHFNGHKVIIWHPQSAHTDGDSIIQFTELNVFHTGDAFVNGAFPFFDLGNGGSMDGYMETLEKLLQKTDKDTVIIPGHGPLANRSDVETTLAMLNLVRQRISNLIADGKSLEEVKAAKPLADLAGDWEKGFITAERMTELSYRSLTAQ